MNARSLGQREWLERAEGALTEDGVDVTDHAVILSIADVESTDISWHGAFRCSSPLGSHR
jgi:hypothetical protein